MIKQTIIETLSRLKGSVSKQKGCAERRGSLTAQLYKDQETALNVAKTALLSESDMIDELFKLTERNNELEKKLSETEREIKVSGLKKVTCKHCGVMFYSHRSDKQCCSPSHSALYSMSKNKRK